MIFNDNCDSLTVVICNYLRSMQYACAQVIEVSKMSSVSEWLESRNYGDLIECFEGKYIHHSYFSCMHPCVDIPIRREHG